MKNSFLNFNSLKSLGLLLLLLISFSSGAQDKQSAYEIWNDMTEAGLNFNDKKTIVKGAKEIPQTGENAIRNAGQMVMFGGEKEGSSALITRVMGPSEEYFKSYISNLKPDNKEKFLKDFLGGFMSGKYHRSNVYNAKKELVSLDLSELKGINFNSLTLTELEDKMKLLVSKGGDTFFSHIKPQARMNLFNGKFSGLTAETSMKKAKPYYNFRALLGDAEKFIEAAHGTSVGWEMNFKPQRSYGEFEYMIDWFRNELKNVGKRFEAPGHQWIVYPKSEKLMSSSKEARKVINGVGEVQKNIQAYIVLKGIEGNAGIELSSFKAVQGDDAFRSSHDTARGVVRLENERFSVDGNKAFAIEYRAGVKSDPIRRRIQKYLVSRYAANEYGDLAKADSWTLREVSNYNSNDLMRRFNVSKLEADRYFKAIDGVSLTKTRNGWDSTRKISHSYLVPLWNWENAPYLSAGKKQELKNLTRTYIKSVAAMSDPNLNEVRGAMRDWAKTSRMSHDIENYLRPKQKIKKKSLAHVYPLKKGASVDVNKIDFGIEYSARFPLKTSADFTEVPGQTKKFEWLKTHYDYSTSERKQIIENFAKRLGKELNDGKDVSVEYIKSDGHGHGLDIAYEVKDKQGRTWRAEWDGIGRNYDLDSKMISESVRGGHVEIVTPKFEPTRFEMKKVFKAMEKENLVAQTRFGGGHINIDLKPFEGKPNKMARFLGAYLENRNVMSVLFQHPKRQMGAEPNHASKTLINKLKNFDGSEAELKKLLYNEKFFNTRVGRKTKNNQLNMTAYFQDVIPENLIHEDFDMKNDIWRRTFDVEPKIRKMEFRMFNAPRDATESALQIKFTKALLNKALNESDNISLVNTDVDYVKMAKNPDLAFKEFEKTMKNLNLDPKEYRGFLLEGLEESKNMIESSQYVSMEERYRMHPETSEWGKAIDKPREVPIASTGRKWNGENPLAEAKVYKQKQMMMREVANNKKQYLNTKGKLNRKLEKLPLEVTISLGDIKKMESENALMALYFQKTNVKNSKEYKDYLDLLVKQEGSTESLAKILGKSTDFSSGYQNFLLKHIPTEYLDGHDKTYLKAYQSLLNSQDPLIRKKAMTYISSHPKGIAKLLKRAEGTALAGSGDNTRLKELLKPLIRYKGKVDQELYPTIMQLASYTDDATVARVIQHLATKFDSVNEQNIYKILMNSPHEYSSKVGVNALINKFPEDFLFYAQKKIGDKDFPAQKKKVLGTFLKQNKNRILQDFTFNKYQLLPDEIKVSALKSILEEKAGSQKGIKVFEKELRSKSFSRLLANSIANKQTNKKLLSWSIEHFNKSKFSNWDSIDAKVRLNAIKNMLASSDDGIQKMGQELFNKLDDIKAKGVLLTHAISSDDFSPKSKKYFLDYMLSEKFSAKDLARFDYWDSQLFEQGLDIYSRKENPSRLKTIQVLSKLNSEGYKPAGKTIMKMVRANDEKVKRTGIVLLGSTNSMEANKALPRLLGAEKLSQRDKALINKMRAKHNQYIKNLDLSKKSLTSYDDLWFAYQKSLLNPKGKSQFKEVMAKNPVLIKTIIEEMQKNHYGEGELDDIYHPKDGRKKGRISKYSKWLMESFANDLSVDFTKNLDQQDLYDLMDLGRASKDKTIRAATVKRLNNLDQTAFEVLAKRGVSFKNEMFLKEILPNLKITAKDLETLRLEDSDIAKAAASAFSDPLTDPKAKTNLYKFVNQIPGSNIEERMLRSLDKNPGNKYLSLYFRKRTSNYAHSALKILKDSSDPVIKKNAIEGFKNIEKTAKSIKNYSDYDAVQALHLLYLKHKDTGKKPRLTNVLTSLKHKEDLVAHFAGTLIDQRYNKTKTTGYYNWLFGLLENEKYVKALGIEEDGMRRILKTGFQIYLNDNFSPSTDTKAFYRVVVADKLVPMKKKLQIIDDIGWSADKLAKLDLYQHLAVIDSDHKAFETLIEEIFLDTRIKKTPADRMKVSKILNQMPARRVERVLSVLKKMDLPAEDLKYIAIGVSHVKSPKIVEFAKKYVDSDDPLLKKSTNRIVANWDKKSTVAKGVSKFKCTGRTIRNVLDRLRFR